MLKTMPKLNIFSFSIAFAANLSPKQYTNTRVADILLNNGKSKLETQSSIINI